MWSTTRCPRIRKTMCTVLAAPAVRGRPARRSASHPRRTRFTFQTSKATSVAIFRARTRTKTSWSTHRHRVGLARNHRNAAAAAGVVPDRTEAEDARAAAAGPPAVVIALAETAHAPERAAPVATDRGPAVAAIRKRHNSHTSTDDCQTRIGAASTQRTRSFTLLFPSA